MPLKIKIPTDTTNTISRTELLYEPIVPRGFAPFSPIDLDDYTRYVKNPILSGNVESDLDYLTQTRASNQPWSHRAANSLIKFGGKSVINTAGTVMSIPMIISTLVQGKGLQGYIDNEMFKLSDEATEWFDKTFPHYLTKAQQDYTTWQKLTRADSGFWGDSVLGGAAFLVGAVAADYLTLGYATPAIISRLAKLTKPINKLVAKAGIKATDDALDLAAKAGKVTDELAQQGTKSTLGSIGRLAVSTATSTGYESALEARHYKEHAMQGVIAQFRNQNFRDPNAQELAALEADVDKASNWVFSLNAVTVGFNNALLFGKLLKTPVGKYLDDMDAAKARRRIKIDPKTGVADVIPRTRFQKTIDGLMVGGTAIREGLEEGLQKAYSEGLYEHVLSNHDLNALDNVSILSAIQHEGLNKAFGTQEGLEEVLVGAILGLTGLPGLGVKGSIAQGIERYRGKDAYSQYLQQLASDYSSNPDTNLHKVVNGMLQMYQANESRGIATTLQDMFEIKNNEGRLLFGWMNSRENLGVLDQSVEQISKTIENMSEQEFRDQYDKSTNIDVNTAKTQVITSLKNAANRYKKAYDLAQTYTQGEVMNAQSRMHTEAIALLAYQTFDLDGREESIANNLKKILPDFNLDINKALTKLQNKQVWLKGAITSSQNKLTRIDRQLVAAQDRLDKANEKYTNDKKTIESPSTAQIDKFTKEIDTLNKEREAIVVEKVEALKEALQDNVELQNELSNNGNIPIDEYNNNFNDYLQQIERAVEQQDKLENAAKTIDRFNYDRLMVELTDLGRIANKRMSLLTAWDYIKSDRGKEQFDFSVNKFRSALIQKNKYDMMYYASLEDFIQDNKLNSPATYKEALEKVRSVLDQKYKEQLTDNYIITKFTVFEAKHNTDSSKNIKVAVTEHKDGNIRIYKIDDKFNRIDSELDVEDFKTQYAQFEDVIIDHQSIIEQYKQNILVQEVGSNEYIDAVKLLVKYVNASNIVITGNKIEYVKDDVTQEVNTAEELFNVLLDDINSKIEQSYDYPKFIKSLVGNEYSSVEQIEQYNDNKDTLVSKYQQKLIDKKNKDYTTLKALLFKDYSQTDLNATLSAYSAELQTDILTFTSLEEDASNALYQSKYFYNLGRNFREQDPTADTTKPPSDVVDKKQEEEKEETGLTGVSKDDSKPKPKPDPSKDIVSLGIDADLGDVEPGGKKEKEETDENNNTSIELQITGALKNFIELATSSGYNIEDIKTAFKEVQEVFKGKEAKLGFEVETVTKVEIYPKSKDRDYRITKGSHRKGKAHYIHLTLNGVRIGRILDGNRFLDLTTLKPLNFNSVEDLQKYNPVLTSSNITEFQLAQQQLNELTDKIIANPNQDVNTLLQSTGFKPITLDDLNNFVLIQDSKLQELITEYDNELSLDNSFKINEYGININGQLVQPIIIKGKLKAIRYINSEGKIITESDGDILKEYEEDIAKLKDTAVKRNNQTDNYIYIQYGNVVRTVDIKVAGISDEAYIVLNEQFIEKFDLKDSFPFVESDTNIKISVESNIPTDAVVEASETVSYNILSTLVKALTRKDDKGNYDINLFRTSKTDSSDVFIRSEFVTYKISKQPSGEFILITPDGSKYNLNKSTLIQQVKDIINQDLIDNQEARLNQLNRISLRDSKNKKQISSELNQPELFITKLGTVAFRLNDSNTDYYPLMIPIDVASDINDSIESSSAVIPNVTFSELQMIGKAEPFSILDNIEEVGGEIVEEEETKLASKETPTTTKVPTTEKVETKEEEIERRRQEELFGNITPLEFETTDTKGRTRKTTVKTKVDENGFKYSFETTVDGISSSTAHPKVTKQEFKNSSIYENLDQDSKDFIDELPEDSIILLQSIAISTDKNSAAGLGNGNITIGYISKEEGGRIDDIVLKYQPNKINAKYDAELDALKPPTTTTETTTTIEEAPVIDKTESRKGEEAPPFNLMAIDNTIFNQLGIDINTLKDNGEVYYTDDDGNLCANKGMVMNRFNAGSKWTVVKDLKNMPTHEQGGIDLQFTDSGVKFTNNNSEILADKGLLLSTDLY